MSQRGQRYFAQGPLQISQAVVWSGFLLLPCGAAAAGAAPSALAGAVEGIGWKRLCEMEAKLPPPPTPTTLLFVVRVGGVPRFNCCKLKLVVQSVDYSTARLFSCYCAKWTTIGPVHFARKAPKRPISRLRSEISPASTQTTRAGPLQEIHLWRKRDTSNYPTTAAGKAQGGRARVIITRTGTGHPSPAAPRDARTAPQCRPAWRPRGTAASTSR